jgi:hypothetical protein
MLAENTKSNFAVGGRLTSDLAGPHFKLTPVGEQASAPQVAPGAMELRAAMQLNLHPSLRQFSSAVQFCYRDGCMTMAGVLPSYFLKQLTQEAIRNLDGVESIDNRICVESSYDSNSKMTSSKEDSPKPIRIVPR